MYSLLDAIASVIVGGLVILMVLTSLLNIQEQAYNTTMQVTTNQISEHVSSILQDYLSNVALNYDPDIAIVHARKKSFRYWGMDYDDSAPIEYHIKQTTQDATTGWWPLQVSIDGSLVMGQFFTEEKFIFEYYDAAGNLFKKIEQVTNDFTAPEDACTTYRRTFDLLGALQKDTFNHIHLENSVLFLKLDD